jgi:hypothetical protein
VLSDGIANETPKPGSGLTQFITTAIVELPVNGTWTSVPAAIREKPITDGTRGPILATNRPVKIGSNAVGSVSGRATGLLSQPVQNVAGRWRGAPHRSTPELQLRAVECS